MNKKSFHNLNILGLIGSVLIIVSEFLVWFSSISLFEYYFITIDIAIENAFLYLFPLMSGLICLSGNILMIFNSSHRVKFAILNIIGLSFLLIFLLQMIPLHHFLYLINHVGIYVFITGLILILMNLINKLII